MKTALRLTVAGILLATFKLSAATLYVSLDSPNPTPPFTNWITAARVIQEAVDAAKAGDTVLVTNGVYAVGEREISVLDTNQQPPRLVSVGLSRVVVTNAIRLESVNGPTLTTVRGSQLRKDEGTVGPTDGIRCVFLETNAVLSGFSLTGGFGSSRYRGGGACGGTLYNCAVTDNVSEVGGGACASTLNNCTLTGNSGVFNGGGATDCTLYNCTLTGNTVLAGDTGGCGWGGGAIGSTLYDCTLSGNSAPNGGGGVARSRLYNCTLTSNRTRNWGGGANGGTLYNCVIVGNSSDGFGGGAVGSTLYNCTITGNTGTGVSGSIVLNSIVYYNSGGNYDTNTTLNSCCTTPLPANGVGIVTGPPLFMDMAAGDFRLREGSPCTDAGTNLVGFSAMVTDQWGEVSVLSYNHEPTDILGNTRFIGGNANGKVAWDIGAYEFNSFKPPRFIGAASRTAEGWTLNIVGEPKKSVQVQKTSNFTAWGEIWSGSLPTEGVQQVIDPDTSETVRFY